MFTRVRFVSLLALLTCGVLLSALSGCGTDQSGNVAPEYVLDRTDVNSATVAHWDFNETSGSVLPDVSGHGHTGIVWRATWAPGCKGNALYFAGNGGYVDVPHHSDFSIAEGTIEIIFRPEGGFSMGPTSGSLFAKERAGFSDGDLEIYLAQNTGALWVEAEGSEGYDPRYTVNSDANVWADDWYHIAYVFGAFGMKLYVNGMLQASTNLFPAHLTNNTWDIAIGYLLDQHTASFKGWIDEVRISNRALSPGEFLTCGTLEVPLDIRPGSCPNPLNPKSKGVLPVAILGTETFDVRNIDPSSVRLEGAPAIRSKFADVTAPALGAEPCGCSQRGPDGIDDLSLKFHVQDVVAALALAGHPNENGESSRPQIVSPSRGDRETMVLTVTGRLLDGTEFEGRDCVVLVGGRKEEVCLVAKWLFDGTGSDETGAHNCVLSGGAAFVPTPWGEGLFTQNPSDYASYVPIPSVSRGRIICRFKLDADHWNNPAFNNPVVLINSNRVGHYIGDVSMSLGPDGRIWFVQENAEPQWTLKSNKADWNAGTWYDVVVQWGENGRRIRVQWNGGFDNVEDAVVSPCFSAEATLATIGSRAWDSPAFGLTIDRLEVRCESDGDDVLQVLSSVLEDSHTL